MPANAVPWRATARDFYHGLLDHNQLTGEIPAELGQLGQLYSLGLNDNQLTGEIPTELVRLSALLGLNLQHNQLTGEIPVELGQMFELRGLNLSSNQLTGKVLAELGQLYQLSTLDLSSNQLTGPIPAELGQLDQLSTLYLQHNQLTGEIPTELGQLSQLRELHLQHNQLTGAIPAELGRLSQLREFSFRGKLAGLIPQELRHLPDLYVLNLAASWVAPGQIKVSWDDSGDPTAEYRFWDPVQGWTDWAEIADSETTLRAGEEGTIEWTLTGPAYLLHRSLPDRLHLHRDKSEEQGGYQSGSDRHSESVGGLRNYIQHGSTTG